MYKKVYIVVDAICGGNKIEEGINPVLELNMISFPNPLNISMSLIEYTRMPKTCNNILNVKIKPYGNINNFFLEQKERDIYSYTNGSELQIAVSSVSEYIKSHMEIYNSIIFIPRSYSAIHALRFLLKKSENPDINYRILFSDFVNIKLQPKLRGGSINSEYFRYAEAVFNFIKSKDKINSELSKVV